MTLAINEAHAVLAPSAAGCWVVCPGARALRQAFPEEGDTLAAMEGTAAHWVFAELLAGRDVCEGIMAPNGVEITEEMIEGANLFVDTVGQQHGGHVEKRVTMHKTVHPANWGTPDFYGLRNGVLRVVDYKFGHKYVEEFENWQLIDYVAGAIEHLDIRPELETQIEITIVQPRHFGRHGPVRSWSTNIREILPYIERLKQAAHSAMGDNAPTIAGPQCENCSGRLHCEANQRAALGGIDGAYSSIPLDLPLGAMAREMRALTRATAIMESRITGIQQQLLTVCRAGANVPGYGIERAEGRQKWIKPAEEIIMMGKLLGIPLEKAAVITPKQAIKKGVAEAVVAGVSEVPLGEWKLVEIDTRAARKVFNQGGQ